MLKVVYSNNMIQLAEQLAVQQEQAPLNAFESETILVQSNELSRWLSLFLANRHGIAANLTFPFPSAYIWQLFHKLWPDIPLQSPYAKASLAWRIYALLPMCISEQGYEAVAAYLGDNSDSLKRYQLAERIADTFDQYLMYRPDWIADWEAGMADSWQGRLWHRLTENESAPKHRAFLLQQMHTLLQQAESRPDVLPSRLSIFGISSLPPVYLQTFELMARFVDITLYYLSPSEHYWGDLRDSKQLQREQLQFSFDDTAISSEPGHPLLASLGKQGQEFFRQLQDTRHDAEAFFIEPQGSTMLNMIQRDMFELEAGEKTVVADDDFSVSIQVCHSAMREIEVLHDQLLAMFERDPELSPTDIVVMTPDIDIYAPWIEAVFGTAGDSRKIPFSIADSSGQQESQLINTFYTLMQLPQSRFDVETVLALLECPAVQQRFGLDDAALSWIREWCRETRTRWGLDQHDKKALDLPATDANTWRAGLDRLILGFAMPLNEPGQPCRLFDGQLAMDGISGERARIVAALCDFVDALDGWRQLFTRPRTITDWQGELNRCIDAFFDTAGLDEEQPEAEVTAIRQQLERLVDSATYARFEDEIGIELILSWLQSHLDAVDNSHRFMGHGVTFCGMVPMRSIPFSVVCLIGMNDDVFPRRQPALSFDLLASHHREGDRSRRDDDRYLFLEALLSAGQTLYISYVGASIVDNSEVPPSVLVSDLEDLLQARFRAGDGGEIIQQIKTHHPLQPFSQRYFDGSNPKLFSFNGAQCPEAISVSDSDWFDGRLPDADASWREVTASQLARFFAHPARFLLRERLNVRLELEEDELDNREPFALDGLESWSLRQQLLQARLIELDDDGLKPLIDATGMLPQGHVGDAWFEQESKTVDEFVDKLAPNLALRSSFDLPVALTIDDFYINGQLHDVSEQGLLRYRLANKKGRDLISSWIDHLLLNIMQPQGVTLETRLIMQDAEVLFLPVTSPTNILANLLKLYWQGCHEPLKFFDKSSYEFARVSLGDKPEKAFITAGRAWQPDGDQQRAEADDPYYQRLYSASPIDEEMAEIALQVYSPIHNHLEGGKL
jgi:exodeoxyribonuclease V gamma subunit